MGGEDQLWLTMVPQAGGLELEPVYATPTSPVQPELDDFEGHYFGLAHDYGTEGPITVTVDELTVTIDDLDVALTPTAVACDSLAANAP